MAYEDNHTNHLNDIIELIRAGKITGENNALEKFSIYLDTVQSIGEFDTNNWRADWRKKVWKLGEEFEKQSPHEFMKLIEKKLALNTTINKEVIEFIKSEIVHNFLPNDCKKQLQILIEKYPLNPEFRHSLGHYYTGENQFLNAIEEYKLAFKIDPSNNAFLESRFSKDQLYLDELIAKGEYQIGLDYIKILLEDDDYINAGNNIRTSLVDFHRRFTDHIIFQIKLKQLESEFKEKMHSELDNERKRIIEVLGFFSAIVAFILSTVSIGKNFSFVEATYFIVTLGIILILFATTLSVLFSTSKKKIFNDTKFWILIAGLILLFWFVIATDSIAKLLVHMTE